MASKKQVSPAVAIVIIVVVLVVVIGLGYQLFMAPKGGQAGAKMSPEDVQSTMKSKGMMQPPDQSGAQGVQQQMQQGGMMSPPGQSPGD